LQWQKIERDDDTLDFHQGTAEPASLRKIARKIYAILSGDWLINDNWFNGHQSMT
jgi:hypothetical protein